LEIKNFPDWIDYMIQEAKIEDMQIISTILYSIWNARNDKEFNGVNIPPEDIVRRALHHLHDFLTNQHARAPKRTSAHGNKRHNICWSPPPNATLKLNVDAHSMSDGHWGFGLVLRRADGSCVGAVTRVRKGSDCVLLAEAMGLQEAITLVQDWNLQNTIIELDAKTIVDTVGSNKNPRTKWGMITTQCAKKMKELNQISVIWTRRNGNKVAHELAKWAGVEPNREWNTNLPSCIIHHIQNDMESISSD
jgi:ribonuclease HI